MNRLQLELQRLYLPQAEVRPAGQDPGANGLADAHGRVPATVRAMVLELSRPADWAALSAVWRGVQADLALPAPAIAVNGSDGFQLWFSLLRPVPAPLAQAFLDALRCRYLADTSLARVAMLPVVADAAPADTVVPPLLQARPVPAVQAGSGLWSAFVAPDLAPMCADEPWLDVAPNSDGQAQLLAPLQSITPADFDLALQRLQPATGQAVAQTLWLAAPGPAPEGAATQPGASLDPRRFLLDVMNNTGLDLALRVEAAKALLPSWDAARAKRQDLAGG